MNPLHEFTNQRTPTAPDFTCSQLLLEIITNLAVRAGNAEAKIQAQELLIQKLEQQLAVVQEREAIRDHPPIDQTEQHAQAAETVAEAESLPEIPDGFIRHDGGACPVNRDATVIAYLSSGRELFTQRKAHQVEWHRCSGCHDVIAYKVIEE